MKTISMFISTLLLSGCASMHYGNFSHLSSVNHAYLANDASNQLVNTYAPEATIICMHKNVHENFAINLVQAMRNKGYGVREQVCSNQELSLSYVIDEPQPGQLYRLSLYTKQQTLSRMYEVTGRTLVPISAWSHKE